MSLYVTTYQHVDACYFSTTYSCTEILRSYSSKRLVFSEALAGSQNVNEDLKVAKTCFCFALLF